MNTVHLDLYKTNEKNSTKNKSFLSIYELICPTLFWSNVRDKKRFFEVASRIIDKKISLEYLLKNCTKTEIINSYIVKKEENLQIKDLNLEEHLKEIFSEK